MSSSVIAGLLAGAVVALAGIAAFVLRFVERRQDHESGVIAQAGREAVAAAIVESNVNKAITAAPDTKAEVIDRLQKGTF